MKKLVSALLVLVASLGAGAASQSTAGSASRPLASAGACATPHPVATAACAAILAAGGNAFDAAVTASATLSVAEPFGSGLGGGGFFLLHEGKSGRDVFVDGRERAPAAATPTMYMKDGKASDDSKFGMRSVAIPFQVALISHTAERYGSLPLKQLLAPAIAAARDGVVVDWHLAEVIGYMGSHMDAGMKAIYMPNGVALKVGEVFRQPELAATLERWAENGGKEFSTGLTAQRMLKAVQAGGGIWRKADLKGIAVTERAPLVGWYRDTKIITAPPPSAGGAAILESLAMLEAKGFKSYGSVEGKHLFVEALRRAYWDRNVYFGDPDYVQIPLARLLSRSHLLQLAEGIGGLATPSASLKAAQPSPEGQHTSHFCVTDAEGNRVGGTQSINLYFGAGVMAEGTGVILNDTMDDFAADVNGSNAYGLAGSEANAVGGGRRPLSSMSPSFAEGPNGVLVTGTPGGSRIPTMVLIALLRFAEGASAAEITATPRIHHQWLPDVLQFEPGALSTEEQAALTAKGHVLKGLKENYGNLSAIVIRPDARVEAASDPRRVGNAALVPATASAVYLQGH